MPAGRPILTSDGYMEMREVEAIRRLSPQLCPYCHLWSIFYSFGEPPAPWGWREEQPPIPWSDKKVFKYCTNAACKHLGMLEVVRDGA